MIDKPVRTILGRYWRTKPSRRLRSKHYGTTAWIAERRMWRIAKRQATERAAGL